MALRNENGITIRQLKEWIKDLPEVDKNGEDYEVWIEMNSGISNIAKTVWSLNEGDILFSSEKSDKDSEIN